MSDVNQKTEIFNSWYALIFFLIQISAVLILIPNTQLSKVYLEEGEQIYDSFGSTTANAIYMKSMNWYQYLFEDSGVNFQIRRIFIPGKFDTGEELSGMDAFGTNVIFPFVLERAEALTTFLYLILQRMSQITVWVPYLLLVFLPAAADGYLMWRVKQYTFSYSSPWIHKFALSSVYFFSIFMAITLFLPFAINPNILPFIAMFLAPIVAISITAHLPKEV